MATKNMRDAFALAYHTLPDVPGRGLRAAVMAGYSEKTARVTASKMLADPKIKQRLAELAGVVPPRAPAPPPAHPSTTAGYPFGPPGADHSYRPETPEDIVSDPMEAQTFDDPKDFLRVAMNNPKIEMKLRLDAAKKLMDFEHSKLGEKGKKEQKDDEAAKLTGGPNPFAPGKVPEKLKLAA